MDFPINFVFHPSDEDHFSKVSHSTLISGSFLIPELGSCLMNIMPAFMSLGHTQWFDWGLFFSRHGPLPLRLFCLLGLTCAVYGEVLLRSLVTTLSWQFLLKSRTQKYDRQMKVLGLLAWTVSCPVPLLSNCLPCLYYHLPKVFYLTWSSL